MTPPLITPIPKPLATAGQFTRRFPALLQDSAVSDTTILEEMMVEATAFVENACDRLFAPFTDHYFSERMYGVTDDVGADAGMPVDLVASLGMSYAASLGANSLVRDFNLDQCAPHYPSLWTYDISSILIYTPYSSTTNATNSLSEGPQKDTGHCRFQLGIFAPEGSTLEVIYSGGYTGGIPADLQRLCLYTAAKFLMLDMEPQDRDKHGYGSIDEQTEMLLASWAKA